MTFWTAFCRTYLEAWRFMIAVPLVAAAAIGFEGVQHLVEWRHGMYENWAAMHAEAHDVGRLVAGGVKVGWLLLLQYWVTRFVVSRGSARTAATYRLAAVRKFAMFFAFMLGLLPLTLFLPNLLEGIGVAARPAAMAGLGAEIASLVLGAFVVPWAVGAALGDARASLPFSIQRAAGSIPWAIALGLLTSLPLLIAHYALGYGAVGRPPALAMGLLVIDTVLVSFVGVAAATNQVMIAERMAQRAGDTLLCDPIADATQAVLSPA